MSMIRRPSTRPHPPRLTTLIAVIGIIVLGCSEVSAPGSPAAAVRSASAPSPAAPVRPSFVVRQLAIDPAQGEVRADDAVTVLATVENEGAVVGTYDAALAVDGVAVDLQTIEIPAGGSRLLEFRIPTGPPGSFTVTLGDARLIVEVLGPAAIVVESIVASPNPAEVGDPIDVVVSLRNGGGLAGDQPVKLKLDGKTVATKQATVPGGATDTVTFTLKAPKGARHTLAVGDVTTKVTVWKITRPPNGKVLTNRIAGGRGQLTIENGNDRDAVFVLARKSSPKKTVLATYVRAGKSATVKGIRDGTYVVYFSLGRRWDSYSRRFTSERDPSRFDDPIKFKTTRSAMWITSSRWTLTLQPVIGGNAPTTDLGDDDFPGVP